MPLLFAVESDWGGKVLVGGGGVFTLCPYKWRKKKKKEGEQSRQAAAVNIGL